MADLAKQTLDAVKEKPLASMGPYECAAIPCEWTAGVECQAAKT